MSIQNNDIDKFFKKNIEDYTQIPSSLVWDAIENSLEKEKYLKLHLKHRNLKRIAAILLLLLCSSLYFIVKSNTSISKTEKDYNTVDKLIANNKDYKTEIKAAENVEYDSLKNNGIKRLTTKKDGVAINNLVLQNKTFATNTQKANIQNTSLYKKLKTKTSSNINIINAEVTYDEQSDNIESNKTIFVENKLVYEIETTKTEPLFLDRKIVSKTKLFNDLKFTNQKNINIKKAIPFSITAYASPEFAINRLEDNKPHQERNTLQPIGISGNNREREDRDKIKKEEDKSASYKAGLLVDFVIGKKWSLQTGLGYVYKSSEIKPKKIFAEQNASGEIKYKNNCTYGATYINPKVGSSPSQGDSTFISNSNNSITYITIPINVQYSINYKKFELIPTAGIGINFLVKQKAVTNIEGDVKQNTNNIEGLKKNYIHTNFGIGVGYFLNKKVILIATPNIQFGLNAINKNTNVKLYTNTVGIMLGLKYKF